MSRKKGLFDHLADSVMGPDYLSEALGVKPHMHPPSIERCTCSNHSRFRIPIKPDTKEGKA